ncbi:MAG: class I SAM-dependent methyltransferase [Bacteroidetes bacterium]|nr:class I SAM-dependent methyltransferase [Bacteroidota bacterium]
MSFLKKIILTLARKCNLTLLKGDHSQESQKMAAPELKSGLVKNCRVLPSRNAILPLLPKGGMIAEVGVGWGGFSEELIKILQPEKFFAIDLFNSKSENSPFLKHIPAGTAQLDYYNKKFALQISEGKLEVRKGYSWDILKEFPDHFFDYIYLDADHSYDAVKKDLERILSKIKPSGLIQLNDYTVYDPVNMQPYGVKKAANEFMNDNNYEMIWYGLDRLGFDDIVIRKVEQD